MASHNKSRFRRFLGFLAFKLVPLTIIVAIIWSGYQIAEAVLRQVDERTSLMSRSSDFEDAATAIAVDVQSTLVALEATQTPTSTTAPTDTPTATLSVTPKPSVTPEPIPTDTPVQPTAAPSSTSSATPEPTATESVAMVVAQVFATNTPRAFGFATNTPVGGQLPVETPVLPTETPTAAPTETPTLQPTETSVPPTATTEPPTVTTAPPTATDVLLQEAPPALPTLLAPLEPPEGLELGGTAVPTRVPFVARDYDLVNILLLGTDAELTNDDFLRTDTMIIVSINRDTGTVSMLSLPRDLYVYAPTPSGLMQRINVIYGVGENIGYTDGGFGLLRQTIWYNLGLNIHYYAMVNFGGFEQIIDTLGGINIAVDCAYQDYPLIGAEVPEGAFETGDEGLRTLPIGYYRMSGAEALWYARTRRVSTDFDRGRRQQQILRAIWQEARSQVSLTNAPQLWNELMQAVTTDMGLDDFISLIPLALNLDMSNIRDFTFVRTYHTTPWQPPDGSFVQLPVYETMRPLLEEFYRPPLQSQLVLEAATIEVYNGTENRDWDRVASERLLWEGFLPSPLGFTQDETYTQTVLIDYTGQQKSTSLSELARILNVSAENIRIEPDPNRTSDFVVILGSDYNSCNASLLPIEE